MRKLCILFVFTTLLLSKNTEVKAQGIFMGNNAQIKSILTDLALGNIFKEEVKEVDAGEDIVEYACRFIGNPYVWGGTSLVNGADCSGFVQAVYAHFDIHVPRTSFAQRSVGEEVPYKNARPGDIICYEGHVGIYIGDGKIVNARSPKEGIGITDAEYEEVLTVRRVF